MRSANEYYRKASLTSCLKPAKVPRAPSRRDKVTRSEDLSPTIQRGLGRSYLEEADRGHLLCGPLHLDAGCLEEFRNLSDSMSLDRRRLQALAYCALTTDKFEQGQRADCRCCAIRSVAGFVGPKLLVFRQDYERGKQHKVLSRLQGDCSLPARGSLR